MDIQSFKRLKLEEQIKKLPVWAQEYVQDVERERDVAIRNLNHYCDSQTKSHIYIREAVSTGEEAGPSTKVRYIQGREVCFFYKDVHLSVSLRHEGITLQWGANEFHASPDYEVSFVPVSFQYARLINVKHIK